MTITNGEVEPKKEALAYSVLELAESLSLDHQTVRKAIKEGKLGAKRVGRRLLVVPEEARRWRDSLPDA